MEASECLLGFDGFWIGHYYDNYWNSFLERTADLGKESWFNISVPVTGTYYIGVQFYNPRMYPFTCRN